MRSTGTEQSVVVMKSCNGAGAKGLRCSAEATGQLATGGARGQGKALRHPQTGSLGSLQACEGQPGSGGGGRRAGDGGPGETFRPPLPDQPTPGLTGGSFSPPAPRPR